MSEDGNTERRFRYQVCVFPGEVSPLDYGTQPAPSPCTLGVETPPDPLKLRTLAEDKVRTVLDWPEPELALLFDQMLKAKWDRGRAESVLRKAKWWL